MTIDLSAISRELKKPVDQIDSAVKLLDDGNTIPFVTRFRKDQTGGLNEEQLLFIKQSVARLRAIADRKAFVLKSIDSQGNLTDKLKAAIEAADSARSLEDIYLPYKPKKQSLASIARQNGLEPLANDIFEGREPDKDLASRATDFVRVDKNLNSVDDVISGVGHILAEKFSDDIELRNELRSIIQNKGKLTTSLVEKDPGEENPISESDKTLTEKTRQQDQDLSEKENENQSAVVKTSTTNDEAVDKSEKKSDPESASSVEAEPDSGQCSVADAENATIATGADSTKQSTNNEESSDEQAIGKTSESNASVTEPASGEATAVKPLKKKKKKKKKKVEDPYQEFKEFSCPVAKMPYHKTLAINRGEKNGRLKVKIEFDETDFLKRAYEKLVPADHPFSEFLRSCVKDSLVRLVIPSLEREIRREVTEAAEKHAVRVFARNLKNLLLQSPVRDHRILAIDPGYKRGCSVAVIDSGGRILEKGHVFVVGNEQRRKESSKKLVDMVNGQGVQLIAIGNGAACREAEQLVSDLIAEHFDGKNLKYAIVNEAGASVYSTSEVGREELPDVTPDVRSAVSIGRRLVDPLSELVKISPANIGVGLYQHDVKAKHLSESLDDVVQFCVNRVGVDVNTASPSLLKYVSGLNQLTARRVYEYRQTNGPFKNREQLKKVAGFGDATFVQSAGFLRVHGGDQPLDATAIHPESYETATKIFERVGGTVDEVFPVASGNCNSTETGPEPEAVSATRSDNTETSHSAIDNQVEKTDTTTSDQPASKSSHDSRDVSSGSNVDQQSTEGSVETVVEQKADGEKNVPTSEQIERRRELVKAIKELDARKLASEIDTGQFMLRDILNSICRPEFDPRNKINRPVFRSGIIKIDDLKNEMCLDAQVVNVVDFGAFVDIGLGTSCLVHVSQLADHFIRDPHRFFAVGDVLKVWVTDVNVEKRRVTLTAVQPQQLRPKRRAKDTRRKQSFRKPSHHKSFKKHAEKRPSFQRRKTPKPVKPITEEMLEGSEPMRSFSDLAQFFDKQSGQDEKKDKN